MTIKDLMKETPRAWFKRASKVGPIKYIGYKLHIKNSRELKSDDKILILYARMFFEVTGATKYKNGKVNKYLLCVEMPYRKDGKRPSLMYELPLKIFSSDPSFNFYIANSLKKTENLLRDENFDRYLSKALIAPSRNHITDDKGRSNEPLLSKHFIRLFQHIAQMRFKSLMDVSKKLSQEWDPKLIKTWI
jgi:hypothetical protein